MFKKSKKNCIIWAKFVDRPDFVVDACYKIQNNFSVFATSVTGANDTIVCGEEFGYI